MSEHAPGAHECARCGAEFGCSAAQAGVSCWCAGVSVPESRLAELAHRFTGCLCPACLDELAHARG